MTLQRVEQTIGCPHCGRSWHIMEGLKHGDACPEVSCPSNSNTPLTSRATVKAVVLSGMLEGDAVTKEVEVDATEGEHLNKALEEATVYDWEDENGFAIEVGDVHEIQHLDARFPGNTAG